MRRRLAVALTMAAVLGLAGPGDAPGNAAPGDPVIATAGDIACAPPATRTSSGCHHRDTANLLVAGGYDAVLPPGDCSRTRNLRQA